LDAPDPHFDYLSLFSGTQAEKVGNPKKEIVKTASKPKKQILTHGIQANSSKDRAMHEGDNRSILDEFNITIYFSLDRFIHIRTFK
jgi:hypothetical protein